MWTIAGALTMISFIVSPIGQRVINGLANQNLTESIMQPTIRTVK